MIYYTQQNCKLYTWDTGIRGLTRGMANLPKVNRSLQKSETKLEDPRFDWGELVCEM